MAMEIEGRFGLSLAFAAALALVALRVALGA
jgi:hypothetical protein